MIQCVVHGGKQGSNHEGPCISHLESLDFILKILENDIMSFHLHQVKDVLYKHETSANLNEVHSLWSQRRETHHLLSKHF